MATDLHLWFLKGKRKNVGLTLLVAGGGLEPPTRGFSVHCYYQLSYPAIKTIKGQFKVLPGTPP